MRRALFAAMAALFVSAEAYAQVEARLVQGPSYGTVRLARGETLLIAEARADCPAAATLAEGVCFSEALAAMRAGGFANAGVVVTNPGGAIRGDIYDVRSTAGQFAATFREDGRTGVLVPRNCYALQGEGVRYEVQQSAAGRIALESQLIVCDGPAPPQPWAASGASIPAAPPAVGASLGGGGNFWPPTSTPLMRGAAMPFASANAGCPAEAVLRDRLCFAGPIAQLQADPAQREVVALGANVQAQPGASVQRVDQYVVRQRRNRIDVDERWFDRPLISAPDGCSMSGAPEYQLSENAGAFFATPVQRARCGPPLAPAPVAIYEFYGDQTFLVTPGSCAQEARLQGGDACFSQVMGYMRQTGQREMQVVSLDANYAPGTVVPFRTSNSRIRYDIISVSATPDYTQWGARNISRYQAGVRPAGGCSLPDTWIPGSEGIIVGSGNVGRFYTWYACPAG